MIHARLVTEVSPNWLSQLFCRPLSGSSRNQKWSASFEILSGGQDLGYRYLIVNLTTEDKGKLMNTDLIVLSCSCPAIRQTIRELTSCSWFEGSTYNSY